MNCDRRGEGLWMGSALRMQTIIHVNILNVMSADEI